MSELRNISPRGRPPYFQNQNQESERQMTEDTGRPNVWVIYNDKIKNLDTAKNYGELREMFIGYVDYGTAIELSIKILSGRYKPGDYLLEIGQPRLVGIVMAVVLDNFSPDGKINM